MKGIGSEFIPREDQVMIFMFNSTSIGGEKMYSADQISKNLNIDQNTIESNYIPNFLSEKLIICSGYSGGKPLYRITPKGSGYVQLNYPNIRNTRKTIEK